MGVADAASVPHIPVTHPGGHQQTDLAYARGLLLSLPEVPGSEDPRSDPLLMRGGSWWVNPQASLPFAGILLKHILYLFHEVPLRTETQLPTGVTLSMIFLLPLSPFHLLTSASWNPFLNQQLTLKFFS